MTYLSCLKYKITLGDVTIEHLLLDVLEFTLWQIVENEMIFKAAEDKVAINHRLFLRYNFNVFGDSLLNCVDFLSLLYWSNKYIVSKELCFWFPTNRFFRALHLKISPLYYRSTIKINELIMEIKQTCWRHQQSGLTNDIHITYWNMSEWLLLWPYSRPDHHYLQGISVFQWPFT